MNLSDGATMNVSSEEGQVRLTFTDAAGDAVPVLMRADTAWTLLDSIAHILIEMEVGE